MKHKAGFGIEAQALRWRNPNRHFCPSKAKRPFRLIQSLVRRGRARRLLGIWGQAPRLFGSAAKRLSTRLTLQRTPNPTMIRVRTIPSRTRLASFMPNAPTHSSNSTEPDATVAAQETFIPTMRELVRTYQAYCSYSESHIRELGLTPCQFDVIATLGNTSGMTMGELAEKTLVTKGTLTGIIDRLEAKQLVRREVPEANRRCFIIVLTPAGEAVFQQIFPCHIAYLKERFERLEPAELELLRILLKKLRAVF